MVSQMNDGNKKHDGLEQKEVRDFLAKEFREAWFLGSTSVKYAQEQYEKAKKQLEDAKRCEALEQIIKNQGWGWFDVSEYERYFKDEYFDFIGTEKEHKQYIKNTSGEESDEL